MAERESLDHSLCKELEKYVEELTTSGNKTLDQGIMKSLKMICKVSDGFVSHLHHLVMTQLQKDHAEIRLSAFQIANEIFIRSHRFRELILNDFHHFLELTAEIDPDYPLPQPKFAAKTLKQQTVAAVQKWYKDFGDSYKKLALGYNYLKNFKQVEFENASARNMMERRVAEERDRRRREFELKKLTTLQTEMLENSPDVLACITQMDSGIDLILPNPDFEIDWDKIYASASSEPMKMTPSNRPIEIDNSNFVDSQDISGNATSSLSNEGVSHCCSCQSLRKMDDPISSTSSDSVEMSNCVCPCHERSVESPSKTTSATGGDSSVIAGRSLDPQSNGESERSQSSASGQFKVPFPVPKTSDSKVGPSQTSELTGLTEADLKMQSHSENGSMQSEDSGSAMSDDSDCDDFEEVPDSASMISKTESTFLREHGMGNWRYNLNIDVTPEVIEDDDNTDIIQNLLDAGRLIDTKFAPMVSRWLEILTKFGGHQDDVRNVLELRKKLTITRDKFEYISKRIQFKPRTHEEPAPKKRAQQAQARSASAWQIQPRRSDVEMSADPTTVEATLQVLKDQFQKAQQPVPMVEPQASTSKIDKEKAKMLKKAPKVQFDADLSFWGMSEKDIRPPAVVRYDSLHRFWTPQENEEIVTPNVVEAMTSRKIEFVGKYEPVKWTCRAPMPNGKLCERMDRIKCPFHGKIVPRDDTGKPIDEQEEAAKKQKETADGAVPDWQDPELLRDIEAAKGVDLGSSKSKSGKGKGKGKGKKKEKYPGLTNLKQTQNTARNRLEKRVLSRSSLKRVASDINRIEAKKFKDKFCNQFNYHFDK